MNLRMATYDGAPNAAKPLTPEELKQVYLYEGKLLEQHRPRQQRTFRRFVERGGKLVEVGTVLRETR